MVAVSPLCCFHQHNACPYQYEAQWLCGNQQELQRSFFCQQFKDRIKYRHLHEEFIPAYEGARFVWFYLMCFVSVVSTIVVTLHFPACFKQYFG